MHYGKNYFDWFERGIADPGIHFGIAEAIYKSFPDESPVLEVGCGRGYITQHLYSLYPKVAGVDISAYAVQNPILPELDLRVADVREHLPWPNEFFKLVLSWQLLEHVNTEEEARKSVFEMARVSNSLQIHSICLDPESVSRDPSHNMIRSRSWWVNLFWKAGWAVDLEYQERLERIGCWEGNRELFVMRPIKNDAGIG